MDTRTKIISLDAAQQAARQARADGKRVKVVAGYFDPLLAAHARRMREIATADSVVFALVDHPEAPVLEGRARAELVAGLAVVDYVILFDAAIPDQSLTGFEPDEVHREEIADQGRTRDLILHVQSRNK